MKSFLRVNWMLLVLMLLLVGCVPVTVTVVVTPTADDIPSATPTESATATATATSTPPATSEPSATAEPEPTETNTPEPTPTQMLPGTEPGGTPEPGENFGGLLENGSFEFPHVCTEYDVISGCVVQPWQPTYYAGDPVEPYQTDPILPPEFARLTPLTLGECVDAPDDPCELIYDGTVVAYIFRGFAPWWAGLTQTVALDHDVYTLSACLFPDFATAQSDLTKTFISPETSTEWPYHLGYRVRFFASFDYGPWHDAIGSGGVKKLPVGEWSCLEHTFVTAFAGEHVIGIEGFAAWGLPTNGLFIDAVSLIPASRIMHTVSPGESWWRVTADLCGDGNLWPTVQAFARRTAFPQPGETLEVVCP